MSPTVFLDRPMGDATEIECTEVTVAGDLLRATDALKAGVTKESILT